VRETWDVMGDPGAEGMGGQGVERASINGTVVSWIWLIGSFFPLALVSASRRQASRQ